jgi:hypothetical protein
MDFADLYLFLHFFFKLEFENIQEWQTVYKDSFYSGGQHHFLEAHTFEF